jgi:hypothetical protein
LVGDQEPLVQVKEIARGYLDPWPVRVLIDDLDDRGIELNTHLETIHIAGLVDDKVDAHTRSRRQGSSSRFHAQGGFSLGTYRPHRKRDQA